MTSGKNRNRVNTHYVEEQFKYTGWVDRSPPSSTIDFLKFFTLTRLKIDEIVEMAPQVKARYEAEKSAFIDEHKNKDKLYNFTFFTDVPFTEEHTLVYEEKMGGKPWYADNSIRILLDIFVLGWI